jgi:hypothetical protein
MVPVGTPATSGPENTPQDRRLTFIENPISQIRGQVLYLHTINYFGKY